MNEVICILIWDNPDSIYTRPVVVDKHTLPTKFKGRKPNKIVVPESCKDKVLLRKIKGIGSYDCKIVEAIGK